LNQPAGNQYKHLAGNQHSCLRNNVFCLQFNSIQQFNGKNYNFLNI
jgi:hypothetical protein